MAHSTHYRGLYPGAGQVAILCEGDVAGYEASLIKKWADRRFGSQPFVDVWPCGKASALSGVSDAIGRCRPIVVIEDRDFRSLDEAATYCKQQKKDRDDRGLTIAMWRTWKRNEIENYFLDLEILSPVMSNVFGCLESDVETALDEVLRAIAPFQVAEYALYQITKFMTKCESDCHRILRQDIKHRPVFYDLSCAFVAPTIDQVMESLDRNVRRWREGLFPGGVVGHPFDGKNVIDQVDIIRGKWMSQTRSDREWILDWSGKDVLQGLRMVLSSRFGWYDPATDSRRKLVWEGLSRGKIGLQDRPLEADIGRYLIERFLQNLQGAIVGEVQTEWGGMAKELEPYGR